MATSGKASSQGASKFRNAGRAELKKPEAIRFGPLNLNKNWDYGNTCFGVTELARLQVGLLPTVAQA